LISQQKLLQHLHDRHIVYQLYTHPPLFTCEQALQIIHDLSVPGTGIKNLFLQGDKKRLYLIVAMYTTRVDLKKLKKSFALKNLRFADAELLMRHLGVQPGSVTPLALINDIDCAVTVIIDAAVFKQECIQVHPLTNDATVVITPADLQLFLQSIGRSYQLYDFND
jgi:Ala-tRNA(Pro) deacylase